MVQVTGLGRSSTEKTSGQFAWFSVATFVDTLKGETYTYVISIYNSTAVHMFYLTTDIIILQMVYVLVNTCMYLSQLQ